MDTPWDVFTRPGRGRPPPPDGEFRRIEDPLARFREILKAATRARRRPWGATPPPEPRPAALPLFGCLFRLALMIILLMIVMAFGGFMLLGGGLLEMLDL